MKLWRCSVPVWALNVLLLLLAASACLVNITPSVLKATDRSDLVIVPLKVSIHTNQSDSLLNKAWQKLFRERFAGAEVISPATLDD